MNRLTNDDGHGCEGGAGIKSAGSMTEARLCSCGRRAPVAVVGMQLLSVVFLWPVGLRWAARGGSEC